jgi:hypothetical protein
MCIIWVNDRQKAASDRNNLILILDDTKTGFTFGIASRNIYTV